MQKQFPAVYLLSLLLFIFAMNGIADYWHLYFLIWWLDIPMHMLGGLWIALFTLSWYFRSPFPKEKEHGVLFVAMFAIAVTMVIGLCWELFEFSAQTFIERAVVNDLADTLGDLVNDFIGAVCASFIFIHMGYNKLT